MPTPEIVTSKSAKPKPAEVQKAAARKGDSGAALSDEELHMLIAQAAYRRAQQRSFAPGHELDDWLAAESEVKQSIGSA
ncbi:MAG TPA: DUF2934 domain-containing protein [Burkholderiales bacterium]|nr:DUF2934 domain-containing protein [Burkholderiales bacterium]